MEKNTKSKLDINLLNINHPRMRTPPLPALARHWSRSGILPKPRENFHRSRYDWPLERETEHRDI